MQKHSRLFYNGTCRLKSSLHSLPPSISSLAPQLSLSNHSKKKSLWPLLNPSFRVCVQLNTVSLATAHSLVRAPYPPRAQDNSFDLLSPLSPITFSVLGLQSLSSGNTHPFLWLLLWTYNCDFQPRLHRVQDSPQTSQNKLLGTGHFKLSSPS